MPSDPSGVHPQGVLARPAPDFFDDNLGVVGFDFVEISPPPGLHYQSYALFNNANSGVVLKVYAITASQDGGGGMTAWFANGTVGSLQNSAIALRPDVGAPFGQIYFQRTDVAAGTPNPFIPASNTFLIGCAGFDSTTTVAPFPLFIVPAMWSLVLSMRSSAEVSGACFWYQVANE